MDLRSDLPTLCEALQLLDDLDRPAQIVVSHSICRDFCEFCYFVTAQRDNAFSRCALANILRRRGRILMRSRAVSDAFDSRWGHLFSPGPRRSGPLSRWSSVGRYGRLRPRPIGCSRAAASPARMVVMATPP